MKKTKNIEISKLLFINRERIKELSGINRVSSYYYDEKPLNETLQEICSLIPEAWQYPSSTVARITYDGNQFLSKKFKETKWKQESSFEISESKTGKIEVFYLKEFPKEDEGPFLKEERDLLNNLSVLISGIATRQVYRQLLVSNTERLKELRGINQISAILKQGRSLEESLQSICDVLPDTWQYPQDTVVRITFDKVKYKTKRFKKTEWGQIQEFVTPVGKKGSIEVYYLKKHPHEFEGPFLKEERDLLNNVAEILSGTAAKTILAELVKNNNERLKELNAINQVADIISQGKTIDETLKIICSFLPQAWQYPDSCVVRISFNEHEYVTRQFIDTPWFMQENFITIDNKKGLIEVFYLNSHPFANDGPFLNEEKLLLNNIARLIAGFINNYKGRELYNKVYFTTREQKKTSDYRDSLIKNKKPIQQFFNQQTIDKYIYLEMMRYKVKDILFISSLYDAFILENEDAFFEQFMGEIYQYSLFSLPRITAVSSADEAFDLLDSVQFDLVILMVGSDRATPIEISKVIKQKKSEIPVYLLLNNKEHVRHFETAIHSISSVDKLFVWNGNSQIFFAIVKSIEDRTNAENDTQVGLVRVILLVEDSSLYYSKYLTMLYSIIFGQVQQLISGYRNELDKISKMRSRPKILHATNYEDAIYLYNKYKDFLLCVISDVSFEHKGKLDRQAGINLVKHIKSEMKDLPIIMQSSEDEHAKTASEMGVGFVNKNSDNLLIELRTIIHNYLLFGDFVFRKPNGEEIVTVKNLREFEKMLAIIPHESLVYHAKQNHFSFWLMSRGEIHIAKILNPIKVSQFEDMEEFRLFIIETINKSHEDKKKGKVIGFEESYDFSEKNIVSLANGSLGGKGRGLAFINTLIYNIDFSNEINFRTPITAIIGTDEFDLFIQRNGLSSIVYHECDYDTIRKHFVKGNLSEAMIKKLQSFCNQIRKPIAVRSSSLFEDSITQPFAGIFDTYILPNNDPSDEARLADLIMAVKLVYASVFSPHAKNYFRAINHKVEEEKMAVVLQELVGNQYGDHYYPHISGVGQSYNFYPMAHMKPEEGFAVMGLGLGCYIVEGGIGYRFSPKYPTLELLSPKEILKSSQVKFFAVNMNSKNIDFVNHGEKASLESMDISEVEKYEIFKHCFSVYNRDNDSFYPGIEASGPRIVNFANILKYNYISLASAIDIVLKTVKEALGIPVEIEFAVDLQKDDTGRASFYLLQIKPLVGSQRECNLDLSSIPQDDIILLSESTMGNGIINDITDIIFVETSQFNKLKTLEMANEVQQINEMMVKENRKYILIGPGRWGTQDPNVGIPVNWGQISAAKVIVEQGLPDYGLDASLGSHFFHNVTSMNIGYFSINSNISSGFIKWEHIHNQQEISSTKHFKHVRFNKPLSVIMDGKKRIAVIVKKDE